MILRVQERQSHAVIAICALVLMKLVGFLEGRDCVLIVVGSEGVLALRIFLLDAGSDAAGDCDSATPVKPIGIPQANRTRQNLLIVASSVVSPYQFVVERPEIVSELAADHR